MRHIMWLTIYVSILITLSSVPAATQVEDARLPGGVTPGTTASAFGVTGDSFIRRRANRVCEYNNDG